MVFDCVWWEKNYLSFQIPRHVVLHDWRLGTMFYSLMTLSIVYFVFDLYSTGSWREYKQVSGSSRITLEYDYPETNATKELPYYYEGSSPANQQLPCYLPHEQFVHQVADWMYGSFWFIPSRYDPSTCLSELEGEFHLLEHQELHVVECVDRSFIIDPENSFTIYVTHAAHTAESDWSDNNQNVNGELKDHDGNVITKFPPCGNGEQCPDALHMEELVIASGIHLDDPSDVPNDWENSYRYEGLILQVLIHYYSPPNSMEMRYEYQVHRTGYTDFSTTYFGFAIDQALFQNVKFGGIRADLVIFGEYGKVSFTAVSIAMAQYFALMRLAFLVVYFVAIYVVKESNLYYDYMCLDTKSYTAYKQGKISTMLTDIEALSEEYVKRSSSAGENSSQDGSEENLNNRSVQRESKQDTNHIKKKNVNKAKYTSQPDSESVKFTIQTDSDSDGVYSIYTDSESESEDVNTCRNEILQTFKMRREEEQYVVIVNEIHPMVYPSYCGAFYSDPHTDSDTDVKYWEDSNTDVIRETFSRNHDVKRKPADVVRRKLPPSRRV